MSGPISRFEHLQREQRRRERRIRWTGYAIIVIGALVIALGLWLFIVVVFAVLGR